MTINAYAKATGTPMFTVRTWIKAGLPHTPATHIQLDVDKVEAWKRENQRGGLSNDTQAAE